MSRRASFEGYEALKMRREHSFVSRERFVEARERAEISRGPGGMEWEWWAAPGLDGATPSLSFWNPRRRFVASGDARGGEKSPCRGGGGRGLCSECLLVMLVMCHETQESGAEPASLRLEVPVLRPNLETAGNFHPDFVPGAGPAGAAGGDAEDVLIPLQVPGVSLWVHPSTLEQSDWGRATTFLKLSK